MNAKHFLQSLVLQGSINVVLFCCILYSFYFLYVTVEEEKAIISLLNDIIGLTPNDGKDDTLETILRTSFKYVPKKYIKQIKDMADKDEATRDEKNNKLKNKILIAIVILSVSLFVLNMIIILASGMNYYPNIPRAILENVIFACILLLLRYIFFKYAVTHWKRLTKTAMLYKIIKPYT